MSDFIPRVMRTTRMSVPFRSATSRDVMLRAEQNLTPGLLWFQLPTELLLPRGVTGSAFGDRFDVRPLKWPLFVVLRGTVGPRSVELALSPNPFTFWVLVVFLAWVLFGSAVITLQLAAMSGAPGLFAGFVTSLAFLVMWYFLALLAGVVRHLSEPVLIDYARSLLGADLDADALLRHARANGAPKGFVALGVVSWLVLMFFSCAGQSWLAVSDRRNAEIARLQATPAPTLTIVATPTATARVFATTMTRTPTPVPTPEFREAELLQTIANLPLRPVGPRDDLSRLLRGECSAIGIYLQKVTVSSDASVQGAIRPFVIRVDYEPSASISAAALDRAYFGIVATLGKRIAATKMNVSRIEIRTLESDGRTRSITQFDSATATGVAAGTITARDVLAKFGR